MRRTARCVAVVTLPAVARALGADVPFVKEAVAKDCSAEEAGQQALSALQLGSSISRHEALASTVSASVSSSGAATATRWTEPLDSRDIPLALSYVESEPSPTDCQDGHPIDFTSPIKEVLARARALNPQMDGSCYYKAMTSCAVAHRARDFFEFSATWPSAFTNLVGRRTNEGGWRDAVMDTEPHVFIYDAEYCVAAGWLDVTKDEEDALLHNYTLLETEVNQECQTYTSQAGNLSLLDTNRIFADTEALIAQQALLPADQRPGFIGKESIFRHQVHHCLIGTADCMRHFCLWNYCRLPGGKIGMGNQCRENFRLKPRGNQSAETA